MKNSFSTFEIILTIIISSIVVTYSMIYIKESIYLNKNNQEIEIYKLDLLSTKAFLQKQSKINDKIRYDNKTLYFDDSILLKDVTMFNINKLHSHIIIQINLNNTINQTWKIKYNE